MTVDVWTTRAHRPAARFEAWRNALSQSHLEWALEPAESATFGARIRQKTLDGIRVVECRCDPCIGWRRGSELRRSDGAYFGVLFNLRGREAVRRDDDEALLEAGDFVMWDSEREMEFRVLEPLHKLTLLIPKSRLKACLADADRYAGIVIRGSAGADGLAAEALRRLARDFPAMENERAHSVVEPVLSLLSATLMTHSPPTKASQAHLDSFRRFSQHIERNLGDSELTPAGVAKEHGVSLRYLHLIFAEQGTSFGRFLRQRRLSRCHQELGAASRAMSVTQIAFRWGFNDAAHFSRAFKAEFGMSPRAVNRAGSASAAPAPVHCDGAEADRARPRALREH